MSNDDFDLAAYLDRIGADAPGAPSLAGLRAIVAAHTAAIPFECMEPLLGRVPKLDIASLQDKLVTRRRGGYCHEHGFLLRSALRALGFTVSSRLARVVLGMPADAPEPVGHQLLRVELPDGAFLVDVGFGNRTPTAPLRWDADGEQATPHETMRLQRAGEDIVVQAMIGEAWENMYRILPQPVLDIDCEVSNWFTGSHPACPLVSNLIVTRAGPGGMRATLFNGRLTIRRPNEDVERHAVADAAAYRDVLAGHFGLAVTADEAEAIVAALDRAGTRGMAHPLFV
jgi:N-hydroxyarylamine O-acetyltransferase